MGFALIYLYGKIAGAIAWVKKNLTEKEWLAKDEGNSDVHSSPGE